MSYRHTGYLELIVGPMFSGKTTRLIDIYNEKYAEKMMIKIVFDELHKKHELGLDAERTKQINGLLVKEYLNEYNGIAA